MTKPGIVAKDLLKFSFISDPQLSPDGTKVVFVKRIINDKKNYQSSLYVKDVTTGVETRFTQADANDTNPRWSPDGNTILFVSNRSGKQQIWSISLTGGEAQQLTHFSNGATNPVYSPDGKQLLVTVSLEEEEPLNGEEASNNNKESKDAELKPYVTTRLKYKAEGEGLLKNNYQQLVVIDLETGAATQLTDGLFDHHDGAFSPDGKRIAFASNQTDDPDRTFRIDIFEIDLASKQITKLTNGEGMFDSPNYSPDGSQISLLGHDLAYTNATLTRVWVLDLATKQLRCLTEDWDVHAEDVAINDMATGVGNAGAVWANDASKLFFLASDHGNTHLYQVNLVDEKVSTVLSGNRQIYAFSFDMNQQKLAIAISDNQTPGDLYLVNLDDKKEQRLTTSNQAWLGERYIAETEAIEFLARDGIPLHGWIMKPIGFEEGKKYPLIVEIHGGPHMMYSNAFMHEFQVLAAKGYGVLYINPRGSHGYGQAFVDAVRGDYGGGDYQDIIDATNYTVETYDWIDKERLGVTGGSYGGFMTNWIVGHTNLFKAAVTQRSISNWLSFYGVSDIGYFFTEWELKTSMLENPDKMWNQSPLRYVNNVETPTLVIHSEKDYRCPIEQGEQFYVALKHRGIPTKFVRYPESNHGLSRNGKPALRISRLNEIVEWFDTYL
ncbi:S9 family peptidase [Aquibacillus sediminis]|uniref:S9 family peptidase n=1 Tax=Aquibacillus sediminis TaxID=2574734 RepID=UPI0011095134|nr:S9 family peptidase [Aquibacillus sediminis]